MPRSGYAASSSKDPCEVATQQALFTAVLKELERKSQRELRGSLLFQPQGLGKSASLYHRSYLTMSPTSANDDGDIEMADVNRDTTEGDLRAIQEESQHRLEGTTNYNVCLFYLFYYVYR